MPFTDTLRVANGFPGFLLKVSTQSTRPFHAEINFLMTKLNDTAWTRSFSITPYRFSSLVYVDANLDGYLDIGIESGYDDPYNNVTSFALFNQAETTYISDPEFAQIDNFYLNSVSHKLSCSEISNRFNLKEFVDSIVDGHRLTIEKRVEHNGEIEQYKRVDGQLMLVEKRIRNEESHPGPTESFPKHQSFTTSQLIDGTMQVVEIITQDLYEGLLKHTPTSAIETEFGTYIEVQRESRRYGRDSRGNFYSFEIMKRIGPKMAKIKSGKKYYKD